MCFSNDKPKAVEAPVAPSPKAPTPAVTVQSPYVADAATGIDGTNSTVRRRQGFQSLRIERASSVNVGG